jgi:hypothetical protein
MNIAYPRLICQQFIKDSSSRVYVFLIFILASKGFSIIQGSRKSKLWGNFSPYLMDFGFSQHTTPKSAIKFRKNQYFGIYLSTIGLSPLFSIS